MSSGTTPSPSPAVRPPWKRAVFVSAGLGAGLALVWAMAALGFYWYYNHARPTRSWPEEEVSSLGIKFNLKTRWRDNNLDYQLTVSPATSISVDAFDKALHASPSRDYSFGIVLYDSSGFRLCEFSASDPHHGDDDRGRYTILEFNSSYSGCPYARYSESRKWSPTWRNFTPVSNEKPTPLVEPPIHTRGAARELWKDKNRWMQLHVGMSETEVRRLLGQPGMIVNYNFGDSWYYPDKAGGGVNFDHDGAVTLVMPPNL